MWGLVPVSGVFREISGSGTLSPQGEASGTVRVAAASIDTKNARRDKHLRSADFLDSDSSPDITFAATGVRPSGRGVTVAGALTVRGRTRPMSFEAEASVQENGEVWLDAEVRVDRGELGVDWNVLGGISMRSTLAVHAVFVRR